VGALMLTVTPPCAWTMTEENSPHKKHMATADIKMRLYFLIISSFLKDFGELALFENIVLTKLIVRWLFYY
jgi:hypothetical protein